MRICVKRNVKETNQEEEELVNVLEVLRYKEEKKDQY